MPSYRSPVVVSTKDEVVLRECFQATPSLIGAIVLGCVKEFSEVTVVVSGNKLLLSVKKKNGIKSLAILKTRSSEYEIEGAPGILFANIENAIESGLKESYE